MKAIDRRQMLRLLVGGVAGLTSAPVVSWATASDRRPRGMPGPLSTRLTREYGLTYPIVGAGMGFYAVPSLVAAISNAGALGVLGASPEPPPRVQAMIRQTKAMTSNLFGVDFVNTTLFGAGMPSVTDAHIAVCVQEGVKLVVFFWNAPERRWVEQLHAAGARVWMQIGSVSGALEAIDVGVDALVAQGAESGGHLRGAHEGTPILRSDLIPEVIEIAGGRMVLGAGGIADGEGLAATISYGAVGAWVGTRFAASAESFAHDEYKRRVVQGKAHDTVVTTMFGPEWPGPHARALRNRVVNEWAGRENEIPVPAPPPACIGTTQFGGLPYLMPKFSATLPTQDTDGDWEEMWFTSGSVSTGRVKDVKPAAQIVAEMAGEARMVMA